MKESDHWKNIAGEKDDETEKDIVNDDNQHPNLDEKQENETLTQTNDIDN